jgi:hypothetical protein
VKQDLPLDLRENRRAKTEEAAYLDLNRSFFLHRLRVLEIGFATPSPRAAVGHLGGEVARAVDARGEISLVEAVLLGETVELAAAYKFKTLLRSAPRWTRRPPWSAPPANAA